MIDSPLPDFAEDFEDFFENAINGFATTTPDGRIVRVNRRLAGWLGFEPVDTKGHVFSEFLTTGGRIYYETHPHAGVFR